MFRSSRWDVYGWPLLLPLILAGVTIFSAFMASTVAAAPVITETTPSWAATGVDAATTVTVKFSEPMDQTSLTTETFTVSKFTGVKAIAAGFSHTLILKNDGTVVAWGDNSVKQTTIPVGLSGIKALAAGESHSLALKNDGTVVAWGRNDYGQTNVPTGLADVKSISAGFGHSLALKNDGTVVAWGLDANGQRKVPTGLGGVTAIAAGAYHSLALKNDGTVVAWGQNNYGQSTVTPGLIGATAIAAGWYHSTALMGDGTLVSWGDGLTDRDVLVSGGLHGVTAIAGGAFHKVALKYDGTVFAWGDNADGQTTVPAGLSRVTAIAAGAYHTVALKYDDTAIAWGRSTYGQAAVPVNSSRTLLPGSVSCDAGSMTAAFTPTVPLPSPAVVTATITGSVKNQAEINLASSYSWSFITSTTASPAQFTLSVAISGTGGGTVYADSGTIACIKGSADNCSSEFPVSDVKLTAIPDWKSLFSGWNGECSGTGSCFAYMDSNRNATATFIPYKQIIINNDLTNGYATLQEAYDRAANDSLIEAHASIFNEDIVFDKVKSVTLDGGKDLDDITLTVGFTEIKGSLTINNGEIVLNNFIIY